MRFLVILSVSYVDDNFRMEELLYTFVALRVRQKW